MDPKLENLVVKLTTDLSITIQNPKSRQTVLATTHNKVGNSHQPMEIHHLKDLRHQDPDYPNQINHMYIDIRIHMYLQYRMPLNVYHIHQL